ncbi:MAG: penicillin-binding protein 2 [Deltaproteobacteria bacterium]|nr:MAG: penicillin-binding protein 2 [Deltaproteobacteria bacterium]
MNAHTRRRSIEAQPVIGRWVRVRVCAAAALLTAGLAGIAVKAYGIQVIDGERYREAARRQHVRTVEVPAPRGVIYDATGAELAVTAGVDSVYANPRQVVDVAGTAAALAAALGLDVRALEAKLSSHRYFTWIKRHVSPAEAAAVRAAGLPGIALAREPRRYYPFKQLAGPVLGFADIDGRGLDGLERALDDLLRGRRVRRAVLRDARGRTMLAGDLDADAEPVAGASVTLTIDRFVQYAAERALADAIAENRAAAGTVVVTEVDTGRVLALASWPTYDPNDPAGRAAARRGARNRAVTDAYELGSIMKVFTVGAALDAGAVRPDQWIDTEGGRYRIGRKVIRDVHPEDALTVAGVIKHSSNVGAVKIAQRLGADRLYAALRRFGFGARTGIELPGERSGVIRPPDRWGDIGLATHAFGYGMTATPVQVAAALGAVGNGGVLYEPRIVRRVRDADGRVLYEHEPAGIRVLRPETAAALLPMLASVFDRGKDGGTARFVRVEGFRAGGKTGTAHKLDPQTHRYSRDRYLSSFIGLAPIDDPKIAVVVVIDDPRGEHHFGGQVAGPAFARIVTETLAYLGVPGTGGQEKDRAAAGRHAAGSERGAAPPSSERGGVGSAGDDEPADESALPFADDARAPAGERDGDRAPALVGLPLAAALDAARDAGFDVTVEGSGTVVAQQPAPGAACPERTLHLVLAPPGAPPAP